MKPTVTCRLLDRDGLLFPVKGQRAWVIRTSDHPKLGPPPATAATYTSIVLEVDIKNGIFETLNTLYKFR